MDLLPITIDDEIACIERELRMRERVYPRQVAAKRMTQEKADREMALMKAVLEHLNLLRAPLPGLNGCKPLILYFRSEEDREEMIAAIRREKPNMRERKI